MTTTTDGTGPLVWYAAYGSNMDLARLGHYLRGGDGPGRSCPGCRDPRPPRCSRPLLLPGGLYFATRSPVWGGGRAFYDPDHTGRPTAARAHLITLAQFSDIAAQEMYREPGTDLDLRRVLAHGRARLGPGRYETLVAAGEADGHPVLTFTAPWPAAEAEPVPPAAAYLRHLGHGVAEAHGWDAERTGRYLAACPGAAGHWTPSAVAALLTGRHGPHTDRDQPAHTNEFDQK
ncbi:histone deacetylase [Streptomyces sp. YIM 98790]|uniref:histone deacetylase n=1 Tax=Streptomyces sp. YIM 98790 TaxID=2689077 RepID=UPI00140A3E12|nr:histone deacetylase [Streptomyces sp. YIM 98790]